MEQKSQIQTTYELDDDYDDYSDEYITDWHLLETYLTDDLQEIIDEYKNFDERLKWIDASIIYKNASITNKNASITNKHEPIIKDLVDSLMIVINQYKHDFSEEIRNECKNNPTDDPSELLRMNDLVMFKQYFKLRRKDIYSNILHVIDIHYSPI